MPLVGLVDELRLGVAPQQHAEIVECRDDALQFHSVDQEYGNRGFVFPYRIEKNILDVLRFLRRHGLPPIIVIAPFGDGFSVPRDGPRAKARTPRAGQGPPGSSQRNLLI